ncbi:putative Transferase 2, rSAM/selenodomain-associated [Desulfovibrio sp. X2]|uniref:TIGR04283 family arsenosugar biosynthesis glycosyltransferase n=1 Tax=Desulfovibrio sp. X2 TaxID=941449 RepID=UPI000358E7FA|nr:TIGR04283 family arsenosugar biosynthesis glycosyltransferase [Desulfovibrio sp. X2]EPR39819.1 putative Transferase 2, rSAM/selenodomain-associated [Desulfovibrio sp. X2]
MNDVPGICHAPGRSESPKPRFSVVVPALFEAASICRTLDAVRAAALRAGVRVEVVVADGDPEGSTLAALAQCGADGEARGDGGFTLRGLGAPRGRALQMNAGASAACGEILVFLHADTLLPEEAFSAVEEALARGARAGAFALDIDSKRPSLRLVAAVATLRGRLFGLPYGDQACFLRREDFARLGGFAELPLMEDVEFARRLSRAGMRPRILPCAVLTSARRWERQGALWCTLRNWLLVALYSLGVPPARLARFYGAMGGNTGEKRS